MNRLNLCLVFNIDLYLFQYSDSHGVSKPDRCTVNNDSVIRQLSIFLLLSLTPSLSLSLLRARRLREARD